MNEEVYFQQRLDDQINWYSNKSSTNQKWYKRLKYLDNFLALIVVPLSYYSDSCWWFKYAGIAAGILIALSNFLQSMNKYHENWIQYRSTAEILKHEKFLYLTRSGGYKNSSAPFNELVERCESIISSENVDWAQLHKGCPSKQL